MGVRRQRRLPAGAGRGEVVARIDVEGFGPYACTLGGEEMRTLFMCESAVLGLDRHPGDGRLMVARVEMPGTGSP